MNLGLAIKRRRRLGDLSQRELGRIAGVSAAYLSLVENGRRLPNVSTLARLAEALRIPVDALLWESVDAPPNLSAEEHRLFEMAKALVRRFYEPQHEPPPPSPTSAPSDAGDPLAGGSVPAPG